jgi:hypothetical protein
MKRSAARWVGWWVLLLIAGATWPQDLDRQKAGVVKVTSRLDGARRTGTGFIVHLDADAAYIVTASHVVEGDNRPLIEFFTRRNATAEAETVRIEGGDPRGLALLVVRGKDRLPAGIGALPLRRGADLRGGESVATIGFPRGGGAWAVVRATVVSREGRDLMLDGSIDEGNSGGPVLMGENVVGVVTLLDGKFARAVPADLVSFVLEGWGVRPDAARAAKGAARRADFASGRECRDHARALRAPARRHELPGHLQRPGAGAGGQRGAHGAAARRRRGLDAEDGVPGLERMPARDERPGRDPLVGLRHRANAGPDARHGRGHARGRRARDTLRHAAGRAGLPAFLKRRASGAATPAGGADARTAASTRAG